MNELKKLTWKYFFQQKKEEIGKALPYLFIPIGVLLLSYFTSFIFTDEEITAFPVSSSMMILYRLFIGLFLLILISIPTMIIGCPLIIWIKSNWDRAKERALKEVLKKYIKKRRKNVNKRTNNKKT